jgi:hypothetical protein
VEITAFQPSNILAILPELGLIILAGVVLALDVIFHAREKALFGWITAAGLLVIALLAAVVARPGDQPASPGGYCAATGLRLPSAWSFFAAAVTLG